MPTTAEIADAIVLAFNDFAKDPEAQLQRVAPLYDENVRFTDPIQTLDGREAFIDMNRRLVARSKELRFDVFERAVDGDNIFFTWRMVFAMKVGPRLEIEGTSHLRVTNGRVTLHRDYWDLAGSVADSIPLAAPFYRALVSKLA
jgi:limonene-1,2-epoxide hydrolase